MHPPRDRRTPAGFAACRGVFFAPLVPTLHRQHCKTAENTGKNDTIPKNYDTRKNFLPSFVRQKIFPQKGTGPRSSGLPILSDSQLQGLS